MAKKRSKDRLGRVGRVEREQRLSNVIRWSMIGIIALVVVVVVYGIVVSTLVTPKVVVATVYDQEITVKDYQTQVRFQRAQLIDTMNQYAQLYQLYTDANTQSQISNYIQQIQYQLDDTEGFGQTIFNQMVDDILIKKAAIDRGITVTEDEVNEQLGSSYGYYPNGYPTPLPTSTPAPTATPAPTEVVEATETNEAAEATDTTEAAEAAEATETAGETAAEPTTAAAPTALPTSITFDDFQATLTAQLEPYRQYGVTDEVFYSMVEAQLYRQKMSDVLAEGISNMEDQVWARHILVADEETAQEVLDKLAEGESFADLAIEYSTDPSAATNAGDLGWFNASAMVAEFSDAAFNAEVGEIVGPVQTTYGYHIIQVLGHEMRQMSDSDFDYQVSLALADFVSSLKGPAQEAGDIVINPDWAKFTPEDPRSPYATQ